MSTQLTVFRPWLQGCQSQLAAFVRVHVHSEYLSVGGDSVREPAVVLWVRSASRVRGRSSPIPYAKSAESTFAGAKSVNLAASADVQSAASNKLLLLPGKFGVLRYQNTRGGAAGLLFYGRV